MKRPGIFARLRDMRKLLSLFAIVSLLAAPALARADRAASGEAALAEALGGATPGKPVSCLNGFQRRDSRTIDGVGILYRNGRVTWLNRLGGSCSMLGRDTILVTRTPTDQLCRGDIAQLVDNASGTFRGSCVFDDFVPYTKGK